LEGNYEESLRLFSGLIQYSLQTNYKSGLYWGYSGALQCFLEMQETEKAASMLKRIEESQANAPTDCEVVIFQAQKATLLYQQRKYDECLKMAEQTLDSMRTTANDILFYAICAYTDETELLLNLWEESLKETSSLRGRTQELMRMAYESCSILTKVSGSYPSVQPRALLYEGQRYFLKRYYRRAWDHWTSALEAARNLGLKREEKLVAEKLRVHMEELESPCMLSGACVQFAKVKAKFGTSQTSL